MIDDHKQRIEALNTEKSYIMQAPAGSGKTEILIQRILALLAVVKKPEEILALTFTRKAATEMRHRIIQALNLQENDIQSPHQRQTYDLAQKALRQNEKYNWSLIENPARLQISTIDSFATGLIGRMPVMSTVGSSPTITSNPHKLYQEAFQNTIKILEDDSKWSNSLGELALYFDNQFSTMEKLFINMLQKREQWLHPLLETSDHTNILASFEQCLENINTASIKRLYNAIPDNIHQEILQIISFSSSNIAKEKDFANYVSKLENLPSADIKSLNFWQFLANLILTKSGSIRKSITKTQGFPSPSSAKGDTKETYSYYKEKMLKILAEIQDRDELVASLQNITALPPIKYPESQWEVVNHLFDILPLLVANLMLVFKEHDQIDFNEVNIRALNSLGNEQEPTDLSLSLDYKIKHLLIDEFQDTSVHHFHFIKGVTREWSQDEDRSIFIVGDPMQSIYRFREAEVGLFLKVREQGINNIKLENLILTSNFRSSMDIVNWCNKVFESGFPKHDDISTGAISFTSSSSTKEVSGIIETHIHQDAESEAELICQMIKSNIAKNPNGKVAILARARKHLQPIIEKLQSHKINFLATDIDSLINKSIIQDLLAICRAVLDPTDNIAWLAILRAPWCGLELSDILTIANHARTTTVYHAILESKNSLTPEGSLRITNLIDIFDYIHNHSKRKPLVETITIIWESLEGPRVIPSETDLQWFNKFIDVLNTYPNITSTREFDEFQNQLENIYITPQMDDKPLVELMTIHKSKGLEFDSVFIVGTDRMSPPTSRNMLEWSEIIFSEKHSSLLLAPIKGVGLESDPIYEYLYSIAKKREIEERKRLMYVACTRAISELHVFIQSESLEDEISPIKSSLIAPFWQSVASITKPNIYNDISKVENEYFTTKHYRLMSIEPKINILENNPFTKENEILPEYNIYQELTNTSIGTLIHLMCKIIVEKSLRDSDIRKLFTSNFIKHKLIELGLPLKELQSSIDMVKKAVENLIKSKIAKWILDSSHSQSYCELKLSSNLNNKLVNIIIDRTFISDDKCWVIDYKVTPSSTEKHTLEQIKQNYGQQLEKYAKIMQQRQENIIMQGIYMPITDEWFQFPYDIDHLVDTKLSP